MTESSGIFTFPSTGIYYVTYKIFCKATIAQSYCDGTIEVTTDNSSYAAAAYASTSFFNDTYTVYQTAMCDYLVDVTDVANVKVRFSINALGTSTTTRGSSTSQMTGATFIRLGDT